MKIDNTRLLALALLALSLLPVSAHAEEMKSADAALAEIEAMFGSVPSYFQVYPRSAVGGALEWMKSTDMSPQAELAAKTRELIALGVAAQIPCRYCIYYHTKAAAAAGATEQEIREAILSAAVVRHWSTILHGNAYDMDAFKEETDGFFPNPPVATRDGIEATLDEFTAAFNRGDAAGVAEHYTEDAAVLPPGAPRADGRTAIEAVWQGAVDAGLADLTLHALEIEAHEDGANETGEFSLTAPAEDGARTTVKGKYIVVWKRGADGSWKLHRDIWNITP